MENFRNKFVTANTKAGAPQYDAVFMAEIKRELLAGAPELEPILDALLVSIFTTPPVDKTVTREPKLMTGQCAIAIGAHRGDIVPDMFEASLSRCAQDNEKERTINVFRSVIMAVWPFVGLPWCVPVMMGISNHLRTAGLESFASRRFM